MSPIPHRDLLVGPTHRAAPDIPLVQLQNNRHVATAELQSVRQHFADLRRTVSALATRRKDAETQGEEASMAFYQLFLVTAAGLVLLHPAVGGALAAHPVTC